MGMRVKDLAAELKIPSKDLIEKLKVLGVEAKNLMSNLEDDAVRLLREDLAKPAHRSKSAAVHAPPPKVKEKVPPPPAPVVVPTPVQEPVAPPVKEKEKEPAAPAVKEKKEKEREEPAKRPTKAKTASEPPKEKTKETKEEKPAQEPVKESVREPVKEAAAEPSQEPVSDDKTIRIQGPLSVKDFAEKLRLRPNRLVAELMSMNILASLNERLDINVTRKIAEKHGFAFEYQKRTTEHRYVPKKPGEDEEKDDQEKPEDLVPRPPIVTFLGHVDHGKTSLLDKIRDAAVAKSEDGGITQHVGAYSVETGGHKITFLDTPGHEAFTQMRSRGANMTDIAVIIIAADDGVMPQTREAIMHAKAAEVSIMVAINKIDLPGAKAERVKQQLQGVGLAPEDWGGDVICCPVSAITGEGVEHLLEMILLQAEMLELRANPKARAKGFVIEASLEPGMGPTANLLVGNGTLRVGDVLVCGSYWGRVRALINDRGIKIKEAPPSTPVKCLGLSGVPEPGAEFKVCLTDKTARFLAEETAQKAKVEQVSVPKRASLDDLFKQLKQSEKLELKVVLKADTQGSIEAIVHSLQDIKSDKVSLHIILSGTGNVTENDVMLASASNAVILGFHVAKEPGVDSQARHEGVEIRHHTIIYELLDEVRNAMSGLLAPEVKEKVIGHAEIREVFPLGKHSKVAGCFITDGRVLSRCRARVRRGKDALYTGSLVSLKHFQNDAAELKEGQECGLRLDNYTAFEKGDTLEFFETEEIKQTL